MNLKHLGDALDYWKGGIIGRLQANLSDIHVLPMFTDAPGTWTSNRLKLYADLVGVDVSNILQQQTPFSSASRKTYFGNLGISDDIDLLVDPDTGIEPNSRNDETHIRLLELGLLLPRGCSRLVLVYQHSPRRKINNWCDDSIQRVVNNSYTEGSLIFAYLAGNVAMLFMSRNYQRLVAVHEVLCEFTSSLIPEMARVTSICG